MLKIDAALTKPYHSGVKAAFHTKGKAFLKNLADELNLAPGTFVVRNNKGGPAVSGEVTLHADNIYIQLSQHFGSGSSLKALYRSCKSQKDYGGGQNNIVALVDLADSNRMSIFVKACQTLNTHSAKMNGRDLSVVVDADNGSSPAMR
jgi:hypothetical protein